MGIFNKAFGAFSPRGKALSMYKRGMAKADQRDLPGAIADYSAVIVMKGVPGDVKAMALLNRALAYSRAHELEKAEADLDRVLAMSDTTQQVRSAAHEKLQRMRMIKARQKDQQ